MKYSCGLVFPIHVNIQLKFSTMFSITYNDLKIALNVIGTITSIHVELRSDV